MMNREIKDWADWAKANGWTVKDDTKGYTHFYTPEGEHVGRYPATPSRPNRRRQELAVALRKNGLTIPPPSKKEQRARRRKGR